MSVLIVSEVTVSQFYASYGVLDGTTEHINPSLIGITVTCPQLSSAVGCLMAGYLGDAIGRKRCVRFGGFVYFVMAYVQAFVPNLACLFG